MAFFKTRSRKVFEKVKMKRKKKTKPNFDLNIQTFSMTSLFQEKKIFETSLKFFFFNLNYVGWTRIQISGSIRCLEISVRWRTSVE